MRLALVPPSKLTSEQLPLYEDIKAGISAKYGAFTTMRDDGTILGPWSAWLHDPKLGTAIWSVTKAMTRFRASHRRLDIRRRRERAADAGDPRRASGSNGDQAAQQESLGSGLGHMLPSFKQLPLGGLGFESYGCAGGSKKLFGFVAMELVGPAYSLLTGSRDPKP